MASKRSSRPSRASRRGGRRTSRRYGDTFSQKSLHALEERVIALQEELRATKRALTKSNFEGVARDDVGTFLVNLRVLTTFAKEITKRLADEYGLHA